MTPTAIVPSVEDIREIYGLVAINSLLHTVKSLALPLLLVVGPGLLLYFFLFRKKAQPLPQKTPEELAFEALEAARMLMTPDLSREFAFSVSSILREYIVRRFKTAATSETTEEFLIRLANAEESPLRKHYRLLTDFLSLCDAAKFARASYSVDALSSLFMGAKHFVEVSKPRLDPDSLTSEAAAG